MGILLRIGSYILHPLFIPIIGWLLYIGIQPVQSWSIIIQHTYKDMLLFTLVIPALFWIYLKLRKKISHWDVTNVKQRMIPLLLYALCLIALLAFGKLDYTIPLKAFIYGTLSSVLTAWLLVFFKIKASLHQMATSALLIFCICLSIYFKINLLLYIAVLILANGWVASSRLYLKRHSPTELLLGFIIGAIPQFYLVSYWL
ncbi:MAG TPA: hypothetical protein VK050_07340 [Flavobacteriaceae bacterium]|nr:hypothetical protein [Flavobacteriaceae bacterium]